MEKTIEKYISSLRFKSQVRYIYGESSSMSLRKGEVGLYPSVFESCPSVKSLINAIEKKASKSEPIRGNPNIVPLCMVMLCSKGYSITSSCFENIDDILIERCWENLKVISHSVEFPLQEWMGNVMGTRTAAMYSAMFCQPHFYDTETEYMSIEVPRHMKFSNSESMGLQLPTTIWNRDDVVAQTVLIHMRLL